MVRMSTGAECIPGDRCRFVLWAPLVSSVELKFVFPEEFMVIMEKREQGYWLKTVEGITPGFRYFYILDGVLQRSDPSSAYQPEGVHGPSEVVDHKQYRWSDSGWRVPPLEEMIIYEIHIGTFTPEGTFDSVIPLLPGLKEFGITAIELMPVAQFPGSRNWGYDGVYPYAVQNSYGGPDGLRRLSDACHNSGLALLLDVVYNHLGPEGNYLSAFAPYFTDRYKSLWSEAVNFDGEYSDGVRNYFIMNAIQWFENYHIDGLRLDAVHSIYDMSAKHILRELSEQVNAYSGSTGRNHYLIAESDLNDSRIVENIESGGYGIDAQWSDDFHHAVHALITGERSGYYQDFGKVSHLAKAITEGYVYSGEYSGYRKRCHGNSSADISGSRMVVFIQNHDQIGNRVYGDRITSIAGFEAHKLAAGILLTAPYIPLLFMGEEYAEAAPFLYFISHGDPDLVEGVRRGRKSEFEFFLHGNDPPDPQSIESFEKSENNRDLMFHNGHSAMFHYYKELIRIRKKTPAFINLIKNNISVETDENRKLLIMRRFYEDSLICAVMNFSSVEISAGIGSKGGRYEKIIDSADTQWAGPGPSAPDLIMNGADTVLKPYNFIIYSETEEQ
jgi:maltooligosyltrehalose trehalohydrolase